MMLAPRRFMADAGASQGGDMAEQSSVIRWLLLALCGIGVGIGAWLVMGSSSQAPVAEDPAAGAPAVTASPPSSESGPPPNEAAVRASPDHRIDEGGRLSIDGASLREGEALVLGLGIDDEARGEEVLTGRVVSVDGRRLDVTAMPVRAEAGGLHLEIDAGWLKPGLYMIEIDSAERAPLALRRYVLEVE